MNTYSGNVCSGELIDEFFECKHITWKISNALPLPNIVDYRVQSPTFSFASAAWKLELYPCGRTEYETNGFIDLTINRLESQFANHHLLFKVYLKTRNGKEFNSYSSNFCFDSKNSGVVVMRYLKTSIFKNKRYYVAPNSVLTVVWEIKTQDTSLMNRFSQIESIAPSLESSAENSKEEPKSSAITCKESSVENSKEEPKSSAATCKGIDDVSETYLPDNKILSDFREIFLKQEDCDVILRVKGKKFSAHRLILKARSPVFASAFCNDMKEKSSGIIDIEDCDPSTFSSFLSFLYSGDVENLSVENAFSLFTTADKYDVQNLRKKCLECMKKKISVDTFCDTIKLALLHSERELIKLSTDFFVKNLRKILLTVKWQSFLAENPTYGNELFMKTLPSVES